MHQYLDLCFLILKKGITRINRTSIKTKGIFGHQMRFNLNKGFPLLTTKKLYLKGIVHELLWFIKGDTNIRYLVQNNVNIWNEWPYKKYTQSLSFKGETLKEFIQKIKDDELFASKHGQLGPIYGAQWRNFYGADQLKKIIQEIKKNPLSRRLIISAWNPPLINEMALPPCHVMMQFYVEDNKLSLQLYQRSGDVFLGIPFNIASYSLLLMMVAQVTNLQPYEFIHTLGDAHIYENHLEQIKIQIQRKPYPLPQIILNPNIRDIENFQFSDFKLKDYICHDVLKGEVAV
ncbi:thymidylate synthase [Columbia Basin potato purple top phytoplasma]|uniref:Thymidylate synthase n=1 Tax=Columbia Basin potato purple top phytoplasma TaxID=307134 RepID=A0ABT5L8N8_9MOLU|nr:thymidylate synthase [Columbia Basin potato purple top phytoplasma]MDC9032009.1 thymidylate synthase [Columbia Basin potato purple top phytoplasma]